MTADGRRKKFSAAYEMSRRLADAKNAKMQENVRILRTQLGLSQSKLADMCGWSRTTIVRLETGACCPSYGQMCVLAKALNVDLRSFGEDLSWVFSAYHGGSLGEELRKKRVLLNLTQQQVAERCGMSRIQYAHIESESRQPTTEELSKLASIIGETVIFAA